MSIFKDVATEAATKKPASPFDYMPDKDMAAAYSALSDSSQAQAVTGSFDEAKGVAGRVNDITSYGGPLMTAARTRAKQKGVGLGLQNTSLAGQAGEQAVIETAMPIASADANFYQQQQLANQNAQNQVAIANAQSRGQIGIAGLNMGESARQFDAGLGWDKEKTGTSLMEQRRQFDATLGLEGKKLDQSQTQFDQTLGLEGQKLSQQDRQFAQDLQLQRDNLAVQREQFAQKLGLDTAQLQLNRDQLSQQDRQFLADLDQKDLQLKQQESQFSRDQSTKVTLANLDVASREKLSQLAESNKSAIAGNENISRAWGTMMDSINQIQNNPDLEAGAKSIMIENVKSGFQSFTNFWKKVGGGSVDVSDLLNFGPVAPGGGGSGGSSDQPAGRTDTNGDGRVDWRDDLGTGV